jgi:hypothetical protein
VKILEQGGVPATQWPDLAPEVLRAEGGFSGAVELWSDLVFIPVHQSLTERDLRAAVRALRAAAEEFG